MKIEHIDNGRKGAFYVGEENNLQAEMTYLWSGSQKIIVDSTHVDPTLRGHGVGQQMLNELVSFARARKLKVMPLCPFAKAQFDKNPSYSDVLF